MANPRKPSALKVIQGTYRPDRGAPNEPAPPRAIPAPPKHLGKLARKLWPDIGFMLDRMGVLTVADAIALEGLCETYAELIEAREQLAKRDGATYQTENGMWRAFPEVAHISELDRRLKSWLAAFGCTPADRARVSAAAEKDGNAFSDF